MSAKKIKNRFGIINYKLYPYLAIFTFATLLIESFTYTGFVRNFIFFGAKFFLIASISSGISLLLQNKSQFNYSSQYKLSINRQVINFNYLSAPVLIFLYYVMAATEAANYPNYVFSTYHLLPDNFVYVVFFNLFNVVLGLAEGYKGTLHDQRRLTLPTFSVPKSVSYPLWFKEVLFMGIIVFSLFYGIDNMARTLTVVVKETGYIFLHPAASYDEKMEAKWHFFYRYMKFIRDNTPEDSAVAIPPPIRPWLSEGNSVLVRYFLYPRFLVTVENEFPTNRKPDYYVIAKGLWKAYDEKDYGWPRQYIQAEQILYLDPSSLMVTRVEKDYDPTDPKNLEAWGLIKVKY